MAFDFVQETRATVRRRVGRLLYPEIYEFVYGATSAAAGSNFTLPALQMVPDDAMVGKIAHYAAGTAAGQSRVVSSNTQSSGSAVVTGSFSPAPITGDVVELWPEYNLPDTVNEHINLAIQRIAPTIGVYVEQAATINADLTIVDIPAGWNKITGVRYIDAYDKIVDYFPLIDPWQDTLGPPSLTIRSTKLYLNRAIPGGTVDMYVRGYRPPALADSDDDLLEVNPTYLVFMTAYMLDSGRAYGQALDPEQHSARATNWYNQAKDIEQRSMTNWAPHTIPLDI